MFLLTIKVLNTIITIFINRSNCLKLKITASYICHIFEVTITSETSRIRYVNHRPTMPETVNSLEGSTELRRILKSIRNSALWSTFFKKFSEEIETNGRYHWMPLRMCGPARHSSFYTRAEYTDGTK